MLKCPLSLPTFSYGSVKLLSVYHMFKPVRYTRTSHLFSLVICLPVLCLPIAIIVALLQNPGPSLPSYLEIAFGSVLLRPLYLPHSWFSLSLWCSTPVSSFMKKVLFSLHTWCLVCLGKEFQDKYVSLTFAVLWSRSPLSSRFLCAATEKSEAALCYVTSFTVCKFWGSCFSS